MDRQAASLRQKVSDTLGNLLAHFEIAMHHEFIISTNVFDMSSGTSSRIELEPVLRLSTDLFSLPAWRFPQRTEYDVSKDTILHSK